MASDGLVGKVALLGGLAAAAIAIYDWLKSSECNTQGSMFYGSFACGWLGLNTAAAAASSQFPLTSKALSSLPSGTVNSAGIANILATAAQALPPNATPDQIATIDSQMANAVGMIPTAYSNCSQQAGTWNPTIPVGFPHSGGSGGSICTLPVSSTPYVPPVPAPIPVIPTPSGPSLSQQLVTAAGGQTVMNMDQWAFYYNQIRTPIPPQTFELMLVAAGLNDSTRETPVTVAQFTAALSGQGLSGSGISAASAFWFPYETLHNPGAY